MDNSFQNSTIAQILEAIIEQLNFEGESKSDIADILLSILNQTPYNKEPDSVIADLLLKLKAKIEGESFDPYDKAYTSNIAEIIISILEETEYKDQPQSRIAELLLELKAELESYIERTATGSIANFITSLALPLVSCEVDDNATKLIHQSGDDTIATAFRGLFLGTYGVVDIGELSWNRFNFSGVYCFYVNLPLMKTSYPKGVSSAFEFKSNIYNPNALLDNQFILDNGNHNGYCYLRCDEYTNVTDFKTAMIGQKLIYELATPTTPTITREQYQALLTVFGLVGNLYDLPLLELPITFKGEQSLFTDNGDISVTYKAKATDEISRNAKAIKKAKALEELKKLEIDDPKDLDFKELELDDEKDTDKRRS